MNNEFWDVLEDNFDDQDASGIRIKGLSQSGWNDYTKDKLNNDMKTNMTTTTCKMRKTIPRMTQIAYCWTYDKSSSADVDFDTMMTQIASCLGYPLNASLS